VYYWKFSIGIQARHLCAGFFFVKGFGFSDFFGGEVAWKGLKDGETIIAGILPVLGV